MVTQWRRTACVALACAALYAVAPSVVAAQSGGISEDRGTVQFSIRDQQFTVTRSGPSCPPSCVQPFRAAQGVITIGELEVLDFLESDVARESGLLLDARGLGAFETGSLPGAVNVPAETLGLANPYRGDLIAALGGRNGDFGGALTLAIFGESAADAAPLSAIQGLLGAGYPAAKIKYYRGGFQAWTSLGLSTVGNAGTRP